MIVITNHPIGGPVFSGPQVTPYHCNPNASNPALGPAIDDQCNAPTKVDFLYRNASNQFVAYDPANPPAASAIQMTTTDAGKTVPFIVQRVTGTADRGIYQIAVLVDPTKPIEPWSIAQPWSHKLYYPYGGACGNDHTQRAPSSVLQATQLGLGFAVANSSLNIYAQNCGDVVSAEATMMTKEIVIERYGRLTYTVGTGGSAGSMQQHLISTNYPGLLDGLITSQVFPDHMDQVMGSLDCRALMHYFWPTAALNGSPLGTAESAVRHERRTAPGLGQQPHERRQPVRAEGAELRRRPGRAASRLRDLLRARDRGDLVAVEPDRRALRELRLHAGDLRRDRHAGRPERQGPIGDRQRRRAVRAEGVAGRADHPGAVRRPELQGRRHRHRRQLHAGTQGSRSGRPRDHVQQRPHERRLRRGRPARDRQPDRRADGRHGLPPGDGVVRLPGPPRQDERPARHVGPVAVPDGRHGPESVQHHAAVARHARRRHVHRPEERQGPAREARRPPRRLLHAGRRDRRPDVQRHLAALRQRAAGRRRAAVERRHEVPAQAARPQRLQRHVHGRAVGVAPGDVPDRRVRLLEARRQPAGAEGDVAHVRERPGRRGARTCAGLRRLSRERDRPAERSRPVRTSASHPAR